MTKFYCPGWETFTDAVIKSLSKTRPPGLVFILWGGYAQKKGNVIDRLFEGLFSFIHTGRVGSSPAASNPISPSFLLSLFLSETFRSLAH